MCKYNIIYFFRTTAILDFGKAEWNEFNQFCAKNDHIRNFEIFYTNIYRFKNLKIIIFQIQKYAPKLSGYAVYFWWSVGTTGLVSMYCMHAELLHKMQISGARKRFLPVQDFRDGTQLYLWHLPEDSSCNMC